MVKNHKSMSNRFMQDMFSGRTDTTYTMLEWAMIELLRHGHPTVLKELQREVNYYWRKIICE